MTVTQKRCRSLRLHQQGAVLISLMLGIFLITGTGLLSSAVEAEKKVASSREVALSLAMAKEALISYAVTYADNYGHNTRGGVGRLPCPAAQPHGSPARSCSVNAIGYLPAVWTRDGKRLDIDYREYFLNQNLWYAVSADFRYNPAFNSLNPSATEAFFTVNGRDDIVAVIIHPGAENAEQNRQAAVVDINDYLEAENADGDDVFRIDPKHNDRVVTISRSELMPLIERRVLGVAKDWLTEYFDQHGHLPYAARMGDPEARCEEGLLVGMIAMTRGNCLYPALGELVSARVPRGRLVADTWFGAYAWSQFIYYQIDETCTSSTAPGDCLDANSNSLLTVDGEAAMALLVSVGREITSQYKGVMQNRLHHPQERASYMDSAQLVDENLHYKLAGLRRSLYSNDQFMVLQ